MACIHHLSSLNQPTNSLPLLYRCTPCPGALLVYDITDNSSFVKVKNWVKELRSQLGKSVTLAIIGNKVDLEKSRAVNKEEALRYAIFVVFFLIVFLFLGPFTHCPAPSQLRAERGGKALRHFSKA
jgi:hypothetical protein